MRSILAVLLLVTIAHGAWSQTKAQACFFSADFEDGTIPAGWTNSSVTIVSSGDPTDAWTVGTAAEANANSYFPVPDLPIGNHFAMANDDALPCDCTMDEVHLTTPNIDLTGRTNLALECRVFHEMTLGGGPARIEASTNGTDWTELDSLDAIGDWQKVFIDLSAYDGSAAFQLRFHWSDGGTWASGFAVDDVCLRERNTIDLSVIGVRFGNDTADVFTLNDQALRYTQLPLEQAAPIFVTAEVMNRGTTTVLNIGAEVDLALDGTSQGSFSSSSVVALAPGQRQHLIIATGYSASGVGDLQASVQLTQDGTDEDPTDNIGIADLRITGPGWEDGYGAMACDDGEVQGSAGSDEGFIAANRMEITNAGSHAHGISAVLGVNSQVGEQIRAMLMDHNFAFIDTSVRHTITQEDIDMAYGGGPIHLPLSAVPALAIGDYFVGMQRLGEDGYVSIATSGTGPIGRSALMLGSTFDITWTTATPMVRLHLNDYGVGLAELPIEQGQGLEVYPVPMNAAGRVRFELPQPGHVELRILDLMGRELVFQDLGTVPSGSHLVDLDVTCLSAGTYVIRVGTDAARMEKRFLVVR